jgi:hypothetical protein
MANSFGSTDVTTVDVDDPCSVAKVLRRVLLTVLSGQNETRISFRDGESQEDVTYGNANITELRKELVRQEGLCAALTGGRPARRCIIAG